MQNEQSPEETLDLFESLKEFIDTLEESTDNESRISGILTLLKTIVDLLEADSNVSSSQSKLLRSLNQSSLAMTNVANEFDEKITTINSSLSQLAEEVIKLAEIVKKIPLINK